MHICLIGPIPPPAGGMANQTRQLKFLLEQEGAIVTLVAVNAPYRPDYIAQIPFLRALFRLIPYIFSLYRAISNTDVCHLMANSGWAWHLFAAPAIWIAHIKRKPMVMNYRGGHAEKFFNSSWRIVQPSIIRCNTIVVPSVYLQRVFAKFDIQTSVVPNVLDKSLFNSTLEKHITSEQASPHLIVTRNLEAIYDIETAIRAFALLKEQWPSAVLSIAGTGPLEVELTKLAAQLNVEKSVRFLGRLSPKQMAELYKSSDLMLNTSLVDNSPNSVIEALACGIPVVSSDVGGIPDLVTHEVDAILLAPGQPEIFSKWACEILSNNELRQRLIQNGLNNTSRFDWERIKESLLTIYNTAVINVAKTNE